ncbi:endo-1,4-beta-xylanase [Carboxylicivirga marina]|uniref:Beta-xylanase n=1 Tax=Carboxylicivirga marina TaxID=2800988 RepID=A0ABS1HPB9_9BACT|nr:endo-1,4-beta-xylanase [Carboxylicivirga marina]MBK3519382.1 endo-1,4-beta-xylanase [Carboxylicivirga marina]
MFKISLFILLIGVMMTSCDKGGLPEPVQVGDVIQPEELALLKELYSEDFLIGVSLNSNFTQNEIEDKSLGLIKSQFNSVVAGNTMKPVNIQRTEGDFYFDEADHFMSIGEMYDMKIIGHTLVWHNQVPDWMFEDEHGNEVSREVLLQRMETHINTLVGRYKGRIHGWDVVNEAINGGAYRDTRWYSIIGENYLDSAFTYAHRADPDAELYYNDFGMQNENKRLAVVNMVKRLQAAGVPIHGIGMQAHYTLNVDVNEVEKSIIAFSELGVNVMITELDISVLPSPPASDIGVKEIGNDPAYDAQYNPYPDALPEEIETQQATKYRDLFNVFLMHREQISRVTFWGLNDLESWKNNHPIKGRTDYPLLFDRDNNPKKAFYELVSQKN